MGKKLKNNQKFVSGSDLKNIKGIFKRLSLIIISELIGIAALIPFTILAASNVSVSVTILPPQAPEITSITAYPNLEAISIEGETVYNTQLLWLEDQVHGEAIQVVTDEKGNFVAALDSSSLATQEGPHKIVALIELVGEKALLLESNEVQYSIDENYNVIKEPFSDYDIIVSDQNITQDELGEMQKQYQLSILSSNKNQPLTYQASSYKKMSFWFIVWQWAILILSGTLIILLVIMRWRRKRFQHESFWSLGKGIHFRPRHF